MFDLEGYKKVVGKIKTVEKSMVSNAKEDLANKIMNREDVDTPYYKGFCEAVEEFSKTLETILKINVDGYRSKLLEDNKDE